MAKGDVLVRMKADTSGYNANIAKARSTLNRFKQDNLSMGGVMKQLSGSLVTAAAGFASVTAAVSALSNAIRYNIETAKNFERSMSQLSSLTGMVGDDLGKLKDYAIELGSATTLSSSQVADAFKMIGSQQPQLLSSGEALKKVTEYAIRLSEAAGIDLSTAAQTLSTSINQMGGDSNNAERYINVLAAASQKGAGDIGWLGGAVQKCAAVAKAAGTDFEELVANLETLAQGGYDASTAGTALRGIIGALEKQSEDNLKPSVVGLTNAFENLGKKQLDIAGYQALLGRNFFSQGMILANNAAKTRDLTEAITGTNTAQEQAKTNTANLDGALKSLASAWEGLNLHINDGNGLIKSGVDGLTEMVRTADKLYTSINGLGDAFGGLGNIIKNVVEVIVDPLLNKVSMVTTAASIAKNLLGGSDAKSNDLTDVDSRVGNISSSKYPLLEQAQTIARYNKEIAQLEGMLNSGGEWGGIVKSQTQPEFFGDQSNKTIQDRIYALKKARDEYEARSNEILWPNRQETDKKSPVADISYDADKATKSIKELQAEIKKLKQLRDEASDAGDMDSVNQYNREIKEIQDRIKLMRGGTIKTPKVKADTIEAPEGSMAALTKEMQELQKAQQLVTDTTGWQYYAEEIDKVKAKMEALKGATAGPDIDALFPQLDVSGQQQGTPKTALQEAQDAIRVQISDQNVQVDENTFTNLLQVAVQNGIDSLNPDFTTFKEMLGEGLNIPDESWEAFVEKLNEQLSDLGIDPIKLDVTTGNIKAITNDTKEMTNAWKSAASAVSSVGGAMKQIDDPAAKIAGIVAEAIASIALGYANATSQASEMGPWVWLAFAAAGLATTITTIAQIKQATAGNYAEGGIIPGNSFSGDLLTANVNSGELILNRAQQDSIASQLMSGEDASVGGNDPVVRVSGEDLLIVVNTALRRRGYGRLAIGDFG